MLTECVFIVIIFSTYLTWHSKYLFPKREMAKSKTKVEPSQINLEYHEASIKKRIKTISKVKSWHVLCAWTLTLQPRPLLFCPPSRPPTAEARTRTFSLSTSPTTSILRIPTQVPQGFWRLLQWTCKPSLCPGRGWGCKFLALESSLTAVWVPCVVGKKPRMFLVIALFSRLVWALAVVATLFLCKSNFPDFLQKRTILLFFAPNATWANFRETNSTSICPSFDECFDICTNSVT